MEFTDDTKLEGLALTEENENVKYETYRNWVRGEGWS